MFEPLYKENRLLYGDNPSIGIVSLWTKKDKIAEKISKDKYAVIGQLFSCERGLDFFVRNLLANPQITQIIITGTDFSKSGIVLKDFFEKGFASGKTEVTNKPVWRVNSQYPGYIDLDIPEGILNNLRNSVNVVWMEDITQLKPEELEQPNEKRERQIFQKQEAELKELPGDKEAVVVKHKYVAGVWLKLLNNILKFGMESGTHYDDQQKEILNLVSIITGEDPDNLHIPNFMPCDKKHVEEYIPKITTDFREDGTSYTYGSRMRSWFGTDQVKNAIARLTRESVSRAVVINLWDSTQDLTIGGSPCLNHVWLRVRDNKLTMTCIIRSNDMFEAYPENAYGLRTLQGLILKELLEELKKKGDNQEIKLGKLIIISQSAHIYNDCWERADEIVKENLPKYTTEPSMRFDRKGNFAISIKDGEINAEQLSSDGDQINLFKGKTAEELRDMIDEKIAISTPEHGMYLGKELMKAEVALKKGIPYEQDEPLNI